MNQITSNKASFRSFLQFSYGTWGLALISFLTTPVVSWLILPEEFGKAAMFTIAYNLLINIVLLGADQSYSRMFLEKENQENRSGFLASTLHLPILLSIVLGVGLLIFWPSISLLLFDQEEKFMLGLLLSLSLPLGILNRIGLLLLRMQKKANAFSILQILSGVLNMAVVLLYAFLVAKDFYAIVVGFMASTFLTTLVCFLLEAKVWRGAFANAFIPINRNIWRYGIPFVPVFLLDWLFQATDRFFLKYYATFGEVGLYVASFKIVAVLNLIQSGFNLFWVPFSYERYNQDAENREIYSQVFGYLSLVMFLAISFLMLISEEIVWLLSEAYAGIADIFPFLLFVPLFYTLSEITVVGINFKKRTSLHIYVSIAALLVNVLLNYLLIPVLGVKGAAIGTAFGFLVFFLSRTVLAQRLYLVNYAWTKFVLALLLTILVSFCQSYYDSGWLSYGLTTAVMVMILVIYRKEVKNLSGIVTKYISS